MSPGAYSKIEAGLTDVNYSRLLRIAAELKVPIIDLLSDHPGQETWNAKRLSFLRKQIFGNIQKLQLLNIQLLELFDEIG